MPGHDAQAGPPEPLLTVHLLVDTGVDDALAVIAAALHPGLRLAEVTVCAGNVPLPAATRNTRLVLEALAPRTNAVLLTRGAATRRDGQPFVERAVHGPDGLAGLRAHEGRDAAEGMPTHVPRVARAAGTLVCAAPQTTLAWLGPGRVVLTYGREGEVNYDMDPDAAREVAATWSVAHAEQAPAVSWDEVENAWEGLPPPDRATPLARLVLALLRHQADRGAGLGEADTGLRLAGSTDPLSDLVDANRR